MSENCLAARLWNDGMVELPACLDVPVGETKFGVLRM